MKIIIKNNKIIKALVIALGLLAFGLVMYLVLLPFYPVLKYKFVYNNLNAQDINAVKREGNQILNHLPETEYSVSANRIIINKIGVNAPIVESESEEYGLSKGAWHTPDSSTPDKGGNTVITGHRFKYLPPSNLTFYLFHKLEIEDIATVIWDNKIYYYRIKKIKVVDPSEISILNQTKESILTMYTCDPIYSTKNRLVIIGELIDKNSN